MSNCFAHKHSQHNVLFRLLRPIAVAQWEQDGLTEMEMEPAKFVPAEELMITTSFAWNLDSAPKDR